MYPKSSAQNATIQPPAIGIAASNADATAAVLVTNGVPACRAIIDCSATPLTRIVSALIVAVTNDTTNTSITACNPCTTGVSDFAVPYATAAVNLIGTGIIGVLAGTLASGGLLMTPTVRAFIFVGVLGGFTTFSSYMLDTMTLAYTGERAIALANILGQTLLGVAAVWAGYSLGLSIR